MAPRESARPSQRHRESGARKHQHRKRKSTTRERPSTADGDQSGHTSHALSADALAQLNQHNVRQSNSRPRDRERDRERQGERERRGGGYDDDREQHRERDRRREVKQKRASRDAYHEVDRIGVEKPRKHHRGKKRRVVSGAMVEEGRGRELRGIRGGDGSSWDSFEKQGLYDKPPSKWKSKKRLWMVIGIISVVLLIIIIVAVVVSQKKSKEEPESEKGDDLGKISPSDIPSGAPTWLNPFQWKDTTDFNLTYTDQSVGDLPVMGLPTQWDDSKAANSRVPPINKAWGSYDTNPARGVNVGGWLCLEPFITPSMFNYNRNLGVIDEWTLCEHLGSQCADKLEQHYATFVTEKTFADIASAGLDHVRIPFSYWAVETYEGDPYVFRTSWRYLLRGIEWARKHGLRVNLDLHGLPGSQNGWNHSGRQGAIGWMNGTDGALNVKRSLEVHDRLSKFFAQDRYKSIISHYGLANEPRMTFLSVTDVMSWTQEAASLVRKNGVKDAVIVFGDGFMGLNKWKGQPNSNNLALDVHQYVIFNTNQIVFTHARKIRYACEGWTEQTLQSMDTSTGFGPTLVAEWSQADTDCRPGLTNVGVGNRWTGTFDVGNATENILEPRCPTTDSKCSCDGANSDPSRYSTAYKKFLKMFAEAQMHSFEKGWGWFYWTWDVEAGTGGSAQWSYKQGMAVGILPAKAYEREFDCDLDQIPDFKDLPETF